MQFKTFERKATRFAGQVAQKGSELLDAGKTKLAIGKEEHAIDELYYKIGEAVYNQSLVDGEVPEYVAADIEAIREHRQRVEELKNGAKVKKEAETSDTSDEYDEVIIDITSEPDKNNE